MTITKAMRADVDALLESGIPPLSFTYTQINDCSSRSPIAYRADLRVASLSLGEMGPALYRRVTDATGEGLLLARWSLREGIRAARAFREAGRHTQFLALPCPVSLAQGDDLYTEIKTLLAEEEVTEPSMLCLEFPHSLLAGNDRKVAHNILDMKLLGVRTMMTGVGRADCPVSNLLTVQVDMAVLDPTITALVGDRDYPNVFPTLSAYLDSMRVRTLAEGVTTDEQIDILNRAEAFGYIADEERYEGRTEHGSHHMTLAEAIDQKEEE